MLNLFWSTKQSTNSVTHIEIRVCLPYTVCIPYVYHIQYVYHMITIYSMFTIYTLLRINMNFVLHTFPRITYSDADSRTWDWSGQSIERARTWRSRSWGDSTQQSAWQTGNRYSLNQKSFVAPTLLMLKNL